jgi:hypothetical protein
VKDFQVGKTVNHQSHISATFNFRHDKVQTCKYICDKDFEKQQSAFGRLFNTVSKSKVEFRQYSTLQDNVHVSACKM